MSETLVKWSSIEAHPAYIEADDEIKLGTLDKYIESRYKHSPTLSKNNLHRVKVGYIEKRELIRDPDVSREELLDRIDAGLRYDNEKYRIDTQATKDRDARFNALRRGLKDFRGEEIVLNDAEKSWRQENDIDNSLETSWTTRRGLDEDDPEKYEVTYALASLGKE